MVFNVKKSLKNISVFALFWVFLFPIAIKSIHYHIQIFACNSKTEKHIHQHHEKCIVCDYEISVFTDFKKNYQLFVSSANDTYSNNYKQDCYLKSDFLFALFRAPPLKV